MTAGGRGGGGGGGGGGGVVMAAEVAKLKPNSDVVLSCLKSTNLSERVTH